MCMLYININLKKDNIIMKMNYFEVNDENNNMSDWLKEQTKISKERSKEAMLKMPIGHGMDVSKQSNIVSLSNPTTLCLWMHFVVDAQNIHTNL